MAINLPKEALGKQSLASLPAKEKNEYLSNVLKKILELNPEGITTSQIKEATGYTYSTIWHHLEMLSATEQCSRKRSGNVEVYFHNKTIMDLNESLISQKDKTAIKLKIIENSHGSFLNIYKEAESDSGKNTMSGICVPASLVKDLKNAIDRAEKNIVSKAPKIDSD